jgi:nitrate reductase NapE component
LQQDRTVRAALLTIVIFGMAALAGVVGYLVWQYCISGL